MFEIISQDNSDNTQNAAVRAIIVDEGQLFLMHLKTSNTYVLPGGSKDEGETLSEALKREVLEETGYRLKAHKKCFAIREMIGTTNRIHHIYQCEIEAKQQPTNLTQEEVALKMEGIKVPLQEGIHLLANNVGTHHLSEAIQMRELIALMHGITQLNNV